MFGIKKRKRPEYSPALSCDQALWVHIPITQTCADTQLKNAVRGQFIARLHSGKLSLFYARSLCSLDDLIIAYQGQKSNPAFPSAFFEEFDIAQDVEDHNASIDLDSLRFSAVHDIAKRRLVICVQGDSYVTEGSQALSSSTAQSLAPHKRVVPIFLRLYFFLQEDQKSIETINNSTSSEQSSLKLIVQCQRSKNAYLIRKDSSEPVNPSKSRKLIRGNQCVLVLHPVSTESQGLFFCVSDAQMTPMPGRRSVEHTQVSSSENRVVAPVVEALHAVPTELAFSPHFTFSLGGFTRMNPCARPAPHPTKKRLRSAFCELFHFWQQLFGSYAHLQPGLPQTPDHTSHAFSDSKYVLESLSPWKAIQTWQNLLTEHHVPIKSESKEPASFSTVKDFWSYGRGFLDQWFHLTASNTLLIQQVGPAWSVSGELWGIVLPLSDGMQSRLSSMRMHLYWKKSRVQQMVIEAVDLPRRDEGVAFQQCTRYAHFIDFTPSSLTGASQVQARLTRFAPSPERTVSLDCKFPYVIDLKAGERLVFDRFHGLA